MVSLGFSWLVWASLVFSFLGLPCLVLACLDLAGHVWAFMGLCGLFLSCLVWGNVWDCLGLSWLATAVLGLFWLALLVWASLG